MSVAALPVIVLGGGGHARVLVDALHRSDRRILGYTAPQSGGELAPGVDWLGEDGTIEGHDPEGVELVNGLGSIGPGGLRRTIFEEWARRSYRFADVRHPAASEASAVSLGQGSQRLAGSILGTGSRLGDNVLINTRAVVEHDCRLGDHVHLATGAILCGGCVVGVGAHVGAGATVLQGVQIGDGALVAAGSVVTKNVARATLVAGVPAVAKRVLDEA